MDECENARTKTVLTVPAGTKHAYITDLLEQIEAEVPVVDGKIALTVKPYEIVTVLLR